MAKRIALHIRDDTNRIYVTRKYSIRKNKKQANRVWRYDWSSFDNCDTSNQLLETMFFTLPLTSKIYTPYDECKNIVTAHK